MPNLESVTWDCVQTLEQGSYQIRGSKSGRKMEINKKTRKHVNVKEMLKVGLMKHWNESYHLGLGADLYPAEGQRTWSQVMGSAVSE